MIKYTYNIFSINYKEKILRCMNIINGFVNLNEYLTLWRTTQRRCPSWTSIEFSEYISTIYWCRVQGRPIVEQKICSWQSSTWSSMCNDTEHVLFNETVFIQFSKSFEKITFIFIKKWHRLFKYLCQIIFQCHQTFGNFTMNCRIISYKLEYHH